MENSSDKIPTNHGLMAVGQIFDHLNYVSYRTQRDAGVSAEICAKWYANHEAFEREYQLDKQLQKQKN